MKKLIAIIALIALLLAACQPIVTDTNTTNTSKNTEAVDEPVVVEEGGMSVVEDEEETSVQEKPEVTEEAVDETVEKPVIKEETQESQEETSQDDYLGLSGTVYVVESTEGNLVKLNPKAEDPDGDTITYTFSEPFDSKGEWQTQIGDEGKYKVTITASDGKAETSEDILVVIKRANRAPEISCESPIIVDEGDLVTINCEFTDIDQDELIIGYKGWMSSSTYQTIFEDSGTHKVTVSAADKVHETTKEVEVIVNDVNRAPIINEDFPISISVKEGIPIMIDTSKIVDPDGDNLSVTFTEPLDQNGEWTPAEGESGIYYVEATISDGTNTITKQINIEVLVKNRPPVFVNLA